MSVSERKFKNYLFTKIEGTEKQPYVLDNVQFCIVNNQQICAFYHVEEGVVENVVTGEKLTNGQIVNLIDEKIGASKDIGNIKYLSSHDLQKMISQAQLKSLFSHKFCSRLKEINNGGYIESTWAPSLNMRASKKQICAVVNDLQKVQNKKIKEFENQPGL